MSPQRVMVVFGTRPEAIKMAPVVAELRARPSQFEAIVCATGQHRQMLTQALEVFELETDHSLEVMKQGQSLDQVVAAVVLGVGEILKNEQPDWILVQGDTSTALAAGLAGFHAGVKVGHVEAGLRTGRRHEPFPEEINRRMLSCLADLHFAPTAHARSALLAEGVDAAKVMVTGNTVIDALHHILDRGPVELPDSVERVLRHPTILITGHRRESFGAGFEAICSGLARLAAANPDHRLLYPVHLNPRVRESVSATLGHLDNVELIEPLDYLSFVEVMRRSVFIITDSGGIQEEATALGKPTLVMRDVTERPEAIQAGLTELVGADADRIFDRAMALLADDTVAERAVDATNTYGDGKAATRIVEALAGSSR